MKGGEVGGFGGGKEEEGACVIAMQKHSLTANSPRRVTEDAILPLLSNYPIKESKKKRTFSLSKASETGLPERAGVAIAVGGGVDSGIFCI